MAIQWAVQEAPERDLAVLRVAGEMDFEARAEFHKALQDLMAKSRNKIVVDLSRISRMSSVFIGTLIDFGGTARTTGKILSVIMVEKLAGICRNSGLDKVMTLIEQKQ
jgi:anti-anti-sigma factor